ncbi:MAG TPA: hypothetical protein VHP63_08075, partial [candidate division Zixibacteria bacterium]|nr:hypothetical protein [candidate division Zixibacteria bacterium]
MKFCLVIIAFLISFPAALLSQVPVPADTSKVDSVSGPITDTLLIPTEEKRLADIQERLKEFQKSEKPTPRFSFYDSLLTYLVSERFNHRSQIDQSFFHDAGDYFRFDPSYVVMDYQSTPMRKTVQPFGLIGNRLNVISNGVPFTPFEHTVEPDGMMDLNDIPTALDGSVYIIPGAMGTLFGGESNIATILSVSSSADSNKPASSIMADKGYFGYAFVRGKYARKFSNNRKIELSASSRKSDGVEFGRGDEQLHYTGSFFVPVKQRFGIGVDAKIYDRDAALVIRPDSGGALINRHRFDRSLRTSFEIQNKSYSARSEFGFRHLRQGSEINGAYYGRFDNTVNGIFFSHEKMVGSKVIKAELTTDFSDYDNGQNESHRFNSSLSFVLASLKKVHNFSLSAKANYSDDYDFLPSTALIYKSDFDKLFVQLSLGFAQIEPMQHQLYLPFRQSSLYGSTVKEYSESGNAQLKKESQLVGNLTLEAGTKGNHLAIQITGGRITDAIVWTMTRQSGAIEVLHFSPVNNDLTFSTITVKPRLQ